MLLSEITPEIYKKIHTEVDKGWELPESFEPSELSARTVQDDGTPNNGTRPPE